MTACAFRAGTAGQAAGCQRRVPLPLQDDNTQVIVINALASDCCTDEFILGPNCTTKTR